LGYANVRVATGDGTLGWPDAAPFDAIMVTAAAPGVPPPLVEQLAKGGRLVIPVGPAEHQELRRVRMSDGIPSQDVLYDCRFVPLVGQYGWPRPVR
jgi:protein-L-isoaspartate(D-aspartate) O-methyltransferase